ncbi:MULTISPECIES: GDYXXLXY domain-containing protein [unclassified Roseitalea]|uniref:GDYXXLXY domain-containing protein n=1 Tax=unclassified Roseitalea TaxID=2639107 RepID=UPI00273EDC4D|nr:MULTISPECIES: GDYXXLXY domain-containing protein [unclassified Roseitalea]
MAERAASTKRFVLPGALIATLALCAMLAWMIADRARILRQGQEVVLRTAPVDPRDLLRGRYVRLGYEAASIEGPALDPLRAALEGVDAQRDLTVYVSVEAGPDGVFEPVRVSLEPPPGGVFLRGTANYASAQTVNLSVDYGIDRFYTNEHRAPELETNMRDGQLTEVVLAVDATGTAQIKALRQGGEVIVTEPLY